MCGIFYLYSKDVIDPHHIQRVVDAYVGPRGPDHKLVTCDEHSFQYSSVLSINKNTTHSGRVQYVGELFDISPTEDEVHYLETTDPYEFVDRNHDGMYSIIWHRGDVVSTVSDPQGEKRLFFYRDDMMFIVSSVPGAIARLLPNIRVNKQSLKRYLSQRHHILVDGCLVDGIYEIPRGLWEFDKHQFTFRRVKHFNYRDWKVSTDQPVDVLKREIDLMKDHEGDSGAMCAVSGGIDSSVVAEMRKPSHTISVRFEDKACAAHLAKPIALTIGSSHKEYIVDVNSYAASALRCIDLVAGVMPTHSMATMHFLGMHAKEDGCKILYGGDGADELFLGYPCYHNNHTLYSSVVGSHEMYYDREMLAHIDDLAVDGRVWSVYDYFFQCGSCQFLAADVAYSDSGIEYRTPFGRRPVAMSAFRMPSSILLDNPLGKGPLVQYYKQVFGIEPSLKVGFAGYPNELQQLVDSVDLNDEEQVLFDEAKPLFSDRDYQWKVVNYKLFKSVYDTQL